jgi:hypothetical protein
MSASAIIKGTSWTITRGRGHVVLVLRQQIGQWKGETQVVLDNTDPAGRVLWELVQAAHEGLAEHAGEPTKPHAEPVNGIASMSVDEAFDIKP